MKTTFAYVLYHLLRENPFMNRVQLFQNNLYQREDGNRKRYSGSVCEQQFCLQSDTWKPSRRTVSFKSVPAKITSDVPWNFSILHHYKIILSFHSEQYYYISYKTFKVSTEIITLPLECSKHFCGEGIRNRSSFSSTSFQR